jgi:hypothetical protein
MDPIECQWIADFLDDKFAAFVQHMRERVEKNGDSAAEALINKLRFLAE